MSETKRVVNALFVCNRAPDGAQKSETIPTRLPMGFCAMDIVCKVNENYLIIAYVFIGKIFFDVILYFAAVL